MSAVRPVVRAGPAGNRAGEVAAVPILPGAAANGRCAGGGGFAASPSPIGGGMMGRRYFRCRNPDCRVRHGALLGRLTLGGGIELYPDSCSVRVFLDTRRAVVKCSHCGRERGFEGPTLAFSSKTVYP